jgi:hypothetical protein
MGKLVHRKAQEDDGYDDDEFGEGEVEHGISCLNGKMKLKIYFQN